MATYGPVSRVLNRIRTEKISRDLVEKGAYVNVVAWADSQASFEEKVKRHSEGLDCILVEFDEVQLMETRMSIPDVPEELIDMRQTANRQPNDTVFGTFHIWHQEESN